MKTVCVRCDLVRSRASEWGIDTNRIGMVGYSAGGEVVSLTTFGPTDGLTNAIDAIDRVNARPDFIAEIYPGPLGVPRRTRRIRRRRFCSVPTTTDFMPSWSPIYWKNIARPKFRRNCTFMRKAATASTRASARNSRPFTTGRNALPTGWATTTFSIPPCRPRA